MSPGDRVRTRITPRETWSNPNHFDNRTGVIEEIRTAERMTGFPMDPRVLVRFDEPGSEHTAFWYAKSELELI